MREKRELEGKVREWQEKVHEAMRLKFGRVVDLDKLGAVTANRTVEDLHSKLKTQETQQAKQLALLKVNHTSYTRISYSKHMWCIRG